MNDAVNKIVTAITYYPTFWFGLAIGLPFLWSSHQLVMHAIDAGADLTATGVVIGAMGTSLVAIMGVFVYRAVKA